MSDFYMVFIIKVSCLYFMTSFFNRGCSFYILLKFFSLLSILIFYFYINIKIKSCIRGNSNTVKTFSLWSENQVGISRLPGP